MEKHYFSPSTRGFYTDDDHGPRQIKDPNWKPPENGTTPLHPVIENPDSKIPSDAVLIMPEQKQTLLEAQANGHSIELIDGTVVSIPPAPLTLEQRWAITRGCRDNLLRGSDWSQAGDVPEALKKKWQVYRQALRDVPQKQKDPSNISWPEAPK